MSKKKENEPKATSYADNMKLWDSVCETNPKITKRVNAKGGFTAIDAQAQIKRATELWGPFGYKWGLRGLEFRELCTSEGIVGITLLAEFYCSYTDDGAKWFIGGFPIASDMPYKPNDDCFKKLQTDCITKALSRLGFNSDVFEGKYDDSKYVAEMNKKYNDLKDNQLPIAKPAPKVVGSAPYHAPNAAEQKIIRKVFDKYMEDVKDNYVVDMSTLKKVIWAKFGKWPTKEESVEKIYNAILIDEVAEPNDFVKGID